MDGNNSDRKYKMKQIETPTDATLENIHVWIKSRHHEWNFRYPLLAPVFILPLVLNQGNLLEMNNASSNVECRIIISHKIAEKVKVFVSQEILITFVPERL